MFNWSIWNVHLVQPLTLGESRRHHADSRKLGGALENPMATFSIIEIPLLPW